MKGKVTTQSLLPAYISGLGCRMCVFFCLGCVCVFVGLCVYVCACVCVCLSLSLLLKSSACIYLCVRLLDVCVCAYA